VAISPAPIRRPPIIRTTALAASTVVLGLSLAWTFLGMRAVMDIGGACASGGPYIPVQPCPEGATALLSVGIPLLVVASLAGSGIALTLGAPTLLLPMWFLLFGSLGWNFLEYAFAGDDVIFGWLIPGVMFELMAIPAVALLIVTRKVPDMVGRPSTGRARWWLLHAATIAGGVVLGVSTFNAWT
jgi:hypothetical protein